MKADTSLINRITVNAKVMAGKPTVRGTRVTVELILTALAAGLSFEMIIEEYVIVEKEDIQACLLYASQLVKEETIHEIAA